MKPRNRHRHRDFRTLLFLSLSLVSACGHRLPPSPMKDEAILSTQNLRIGLFDENREIDRSALLNCPNEFPGIDFQTEPAVHRALRDVGMTPDQLIRESDDFEKYRAISGFDLLLIISGSGGRHYLKTVNFLGRYVSTVVLDLKTPMCGDILRGQRLVVFESHPPIADVFLDERYVGEAPVWVWLRDGHYEVTCKLPEQIFTRTSVKIPPTIRTTCSRENATANSKDTDDMAKMTGEEKAGSVLVYIVGAVASLAAIILPILLFL